MSLARCLSTAMLVATIAAVAVGSIACGAGNQTTTAPRDVPDACRQLDIVAEAAATLATTLDIIEANNPDTRQAAAEIRMYGQERADVIQCVRLLIPAINARLESDRELLKSYARKVGPTQERASKLRKEIPAMFEDAEVRAAIKSTQ